MSLKETWKKFTDKLPFTISFDLSGPVNNIEYSTFQHIQQKVLEETDFSVSCRSSRWVGCFSDVGLVMAPETSADQVTKAEDVFLAAAAEKDCKLTRDQIVRYTAATSPTPSRLVQPRVK